MKRIAYLITDSGMDGRDRETILSAFWEEAERDKALNADPSKPYRGTREMIVDVEPATKAALTSLNGLDRLLLGITEPHPATVPKKKNS